MSQSVHRESPRWILLALGQAALGAACQTTQPVIDEYVTPGSLAESELYEPNYVKPCGGSGSLDEIMNQGLNPRLSEMAANLFHDERPAGERLPAVADAAGAMLGCIPLMRQVANERSPDEARAFNNEITMLRINAIAAQVSALEMDQDAALHWFVHIRQTCASCHAQFKPNATAGP